MVELHRVDETLSWFDLEPCATPGFVSVYLILDEQIGVVETGPACGHDRFLDGLEVAGVAPAEVDWILPTHIHLDHAGGAGHLAGVCANARVLLHPRGVAHMVNPAQLWQGSLDFLGEVAEAYGPPLPLGPGQAVAASEGRQIELGATTLQVHFTPGHASHHLCFFEPQKGWLFSGDAAGLAYPQVAGALPVTPAPYRHDLQLETLARLRALEPSLLCYTHFGPREQAGERLAQVEAEYRAWIDLAREALAAAAAAGSTKLILEAAHAQLLATRPLAAVTEKVNAGRFPQRDTHLRSVEGMVSYLEWQRRRAG